MKRSILSILTVFLVTISSAQTDSTFKEYTGRYVFPDGNVVPDVTVTLEGEALMMSSSAGTSSLTRLGIDSFSVVEFSGTAVFKRNASGKVNGVHIEAAGYIMDGTKDEGTGWSGTGMGRIEMSSGRAGWLSIRRFLQMGLHTL